MFCLAGNQKYKVEFKLSIKVEINSFLGAGSSATVYKTKTPFSTDCGAIKFYCDLENFLEQMNDEEVEDFYIEINLARQNIPKQLEYDMHAWQLGILDDLAPKILHIEEITAVLNCITISVFVVVCELCFPLEKIAMLEIELVCYKILNFMRKNKIVLYDLSIENLMRDSLKKIVIVDWGECGKVKGHKLRADSNEIIYELIGRLEPLYEGPKSQLIHLQNKIKLV